MDKKLESIVAGLLRPGETVLEQCSGADGPTPCTAVLTNRRLLFIYAGWTNLADPRVSDVRLEDVLTVDVVSRGRLCVDARSGVFGISTGYGKKVNHWPNLILAAQDALKYAARSPAASSSDRAVGVGDQLSQLSALRDTGALTDEEFVAAKKRLLTN